MCHAFDPDAKDGHDLLIGLNSGDGEKDFELVLFNLSSRCVVPWIDSYCLCVLLQCTLYR